MTDQLRQRLIPSAPTRTQASWTQMSAQVSALEHPRRSPGWGLGREQYLVCKVRYGVQLYPIPHFLVPAEFSYGVQLYPIGRGVLKAQCAGGGAWPSVTGQTHVSILDILLFFPVPMVDVILR